MKNIKQFENYAVEQFTAQDLDTALLMMADWLLDSIAEQDFSMSPYDKSREIIAMLKNKDIKIGNVENKWKTVDFSTLPDKKWSSTFTTRKKF